MTVDQYVKFMVDSGFWDSRDLEPIKCHHCGSTDLEDTGHIVEELGTHCVTEYTKVCKGCGKEVGLWAYGYWQI